MPSRRNRSPRLLTAGYLTLDLIVRDVIARDFWHAAGGTCGNVSVFSSSLGAEVSILARVGDDRRGKNLVKILVQTGVDIVGVERVAGFNTPGIVELVRSKPDGQHRFTFRCPACGGRLPKAAVVSKRQAQLMTRHIGNYDAYFFDRATPATVYIARIARNADLCVVFEPNTSPKTTLAKHAAELSDIVKISQKSNNGDQNWQPDPGSNTRYIIETLADRGARLKSKTRGRWDDWQEFPAIPQPCIRDAAGAGDWMTAGLMTRILSNPDPLGIETVRAAIDYGQRLSAISLAFDGPNGALTALGPATIQRIAGSTPPIMIPDCQITSGLVVKSKLGGSMQCCVLCLAEKSAGW